MVSTLLLEEISSMNVWFGMVSSEINGGDGKGYTK